MNIDKNTNILIDRYNYLESELSNKLNDLFRNKISTIEELTLANELLAQYKILTGRNFKLDKENNLI